MTETCKHEWGEKDDPNIPAPCVKCEQTPIEAFMPRGATITIEFPSKEHAAAFKSFMCDGSGEQNLWEIFEMNGQQGMGFDWHQGDLVPTKLWGTDD